MEQFKRTCAASFLILAVSIFTISSCSKSEEENIVTPTHEIPDLTKLPLGGTAPYKILIRNQGNPNPDFLSLWLCGLPSNGAGANNAADWTNPDGTWDYTKKPQVAGNVIWTSEFKITLDGNGNRVLTGNGLPNHPTGVFLYNKVL
ncbi:MAG: hypothetical protein IPL31_01260 [Saprospiraceae bacterium]|nr:hypothetical protein [Saprospiraceae bacterium]